MQSSPPVLQWFVAVSAAPTVPPVAVTERVYVAVRTGAIAAYRLTDGQRLWSSDLPAEQPLAVDDTHVFVASGEALHALQGTSGDAAWRAPTGKITAPPLVHAGWVVVAADNALTAFRADDGTRVWRQDIGPIDRRPFIDGDALFISVTDGRILKLDLKDGTTQWERSLGGAPGEPLVVGDRVYVGAADKYFYCLKVDDGSIDWPRRIGAEVRGRPAADADRVYFAALDNEVRALDRGSGALRWHHGVPFRPSAGPFLLGGTVVITGPVAELFLFDAVNGTALKSYTLKEPIVSAPSLVGDDASQMRVAAITGGLNDQWKLTMFGPAGETPQPVPILPLTVLPGVVLPTPK